MTRKLISLLLIFSMILPTITALAATQTYMYFDSNGGTPVDPVPATAGMLVPEPEPPTREGFTFGGWYLDKTLKYQKWDFSKATFISNFNTLYARWDYTVHFETFGGTVYPDAAALPGDVIRSPGYPQRLGYDFEGWFKDPEFTKSWDFSKDVVTGNITIYAKWRARLNMVTYKRIDPILGNQTYWKVQVATDELVTPPPQTPQKDGYTFDGWYTDLGLTNRFNFAVDTLTSDITLYDSWLPNEYTLTLDPKNGSPVTKITGYYENTLPEPEAPKRQGYVFGGWWQEGVSAPFNFSKQRISSDLQLYARWLTSDEVTVTFDTRGGSSISPVKVKYGSKVTAPAPPTKKGYVFDGWYIGDVNTYFFDFGGTRVYDNITLKARWYQEQPAQSGAGSIYQTNLALFKQIPTDTYGVEQFLHFVDEDHKPIPQEIVSLAKSLTKNCKNDYEKIQVISNWVKDNIYYDYETYRGQANRSQDSATVYRLRTGVCDGYTNLHVDMLRAVNIPALKIIGKATSQWEAHAWTQAFLKNEDRWMIIDTTFNSTAYTNRYFDISLEEVSYDHKYERIAEIRRPVLVQFMYTSIFDTVENRDQKLYRQKLTAPTPPTRSGYDFMGWYPASNSSSDDATPWNFDTDIVKGDTYLVAKWKLKDVTLDFDSNGGSTVPSVTAPYGTLYRTVPTPTRQGYSFAGWYHDTNFTFKWDNSIPPGTSRTMYAKWEKTTMLPEGWYTIGLNGSYLNMASNGSGEIRQSDYPEFFYVKCSTIDDLCTIQTVNETFVGNAKTITNGLQIGIVANSYNWKIEANGNGYVLRSVSKKDFILAASGGKTADGTAVVFSNTDTAGAANTLFTFIPKTATVTFDSKGGSAVEPQTLLCGTMISKPANPTRNGYTFAGWFEDAACTKPVTFPYTITSYTTLYAKWNANAFRVEFYTGPGTKVDAQFIDAGGKVTKPADPTLDLNTFGGWYKDSHCQTPWNFDTDTVTKDMPLYAKWDFNYSTMLGNINGDDKINATDARMVLQASVGKITLTEQQKAQADVNRDGKVNTTDARLILQYAVGKIVEFPRPEED